MKETPFNEFAMEDKLLEENHQLKLQIEKLLQERDLYKKAYESLKSEVN